MTHVRFRTALSFTSNPMQETNRVNLTLEFETAERLLLAAQFRKKEINPLDYIYRAIGCDIAPLNPDEQPDEVMLNLGPV